MQGSLNFVEIAGVDDVPPGSVRAFRLGERRIAVYHTARGFFASDDVCPHRGGPLHEGDVIGNEIVCPWHLWSFDVETGVNPGVDDVCLQTHAVREQDGRIFVALSEVSSC